MKVLRLHFTLPVAHWRVPFTQQHIHRTYPLPPPSTVLGMIHNVCGCKKEEKILGIDMAIAGKYEFMFYQYQLFRNLANPVKHAYKEAHPGQSMPTQVQLLGNVELYIYLSIQKDVKPKNEKEEKVLSLDEIKNYFANPSVPFIIGRKEDIAVLEDEPVIIELEEKPLPFSLQKFSCWVPVDQNSGLKGVVYLLPFYYEKINDIRNFKKIRCIYAEPQVIPLVNNEVNQKTKNQNANPGVAIPLVNNEVSRGYVDEVFCIENRKDKEDKKVKIPVFFLKSEEKENGKQ
ncbi:type I-B CRISPR-associated protein Cas5 [Candidatus Pacearchaeota archaeon]|nr:MAG: type I-B CRISPR-associated protein Cas5 [Candidatus Pacearchaeota archaeon]